MTVSDPEKLLMRDIYSRREDGWRKLRNEELNNVYP
jgi:hypothetical protein